MKRFLFLLALLSYAPQSLACDVLLGKYGQAKTVTFCLYKTDGTELKVDAEHASGDTVVTKDEGAPASTTNAFADEGSCYSLALTATEMQAARVSLQIIDQGTKAWLDKCVTVETYGNASAEHAFDLDTATVLPPDGGLTPVKFGADGVLASVAGTTIGLATGAVDADDQFNSGWRIEFKGTDRQGSACITDSTNTGDTVVIAAAPSPAPETGDGYAIYPDGACAAVVVTTNNDKTGYTCSTVSDKTGYSLTQAFPTNFSALDITVGGVVSAALGTTPSCTLEDDAITAAKITEAAAEMLADYVLRRGSANIEASSYGDTLARKSLYGVIAQQTHRTKNEGGQLKLYKADGTTVLSTRTATGQAGADPIVELGD